MNREELEARAKELDIGFNARTADDVLAERIEDREAKAKAAAEAAEAAAGVEPVVQVAEPAPTGPDEMVRVLVPNLWTSQGKYFAGDDIALPASEAKALEDADKVVIK